MCPLQCGGIHKRSSPLTLRTKRGFHLYFRHVGQKPKQVRLPNIAIDFKSGENEFVVGPKSERPDGAVYEPDGPLVAFDALPRFEDRDDLPGTEQAAPARVGGRYQQGVRHEVLKRQAHQLALTCETFADLFSELLAFRECEIERPLDFSDARLEDLARWFWLKRERGELWSGRFVALRYAELTPGPANVEAIDKMARAMHPEAF